MAGPVPATGQTAGSVENTELQALLAAPQAEFAPAGQQLELQPPAATGLHRKGIAPANRFLVK